MKKILAILLALTLVFAMAACGDDPVDPVDTDPITDTTPADDTDDTTEPDDTDPVDPALGVMSYDEYVAAELDTEVLVEVYVQATQSWWNDTITVYAADEDGAYFIYNMECSEDDAALLVPGTKILVNGYKAEWSGEIEIIDATFEFAGDDTYVAEAVDATALLGTDELIDLQNQLVAFNGLTVKSVEFKNDGGDDIYVTVTKDNADYSFCIEVYLTGTETEVYQTAANLKAGDMINVEGFAYWYEGINTHITAIEAAK